MLFLGRQYESFYQIKKKKDIFMSQIQIRLDF